MDNNSRDEGYGEQGQGQGQGQGGEYVDKFNPEEHEVIVRGLSYQATDDDVTEFFGKYGPVKSVKIERYFDGNSKGSCFVKFDSEIGVSEAVKASGVEFLGRQVWIDKTRPKSERVKEYGGQRRNRGYQGGGRNYNNDRGYGGGNRRRGGYNRGGYGRGGYSRGGGGGGYYNQGGYNDGGNDYYGGHGGGGGGGYRRRGGYNNNRRGGHGGYRERPQESKIVFVGNLNYRTEKDEIWEHFEAVGKVIDVRVARNPSGSKKGFAHVEFDTFEDANNALTLHDKELGGRRLRVDLAAASRGGRND